MTNPLQRRLQVSRIVAEHGAGDQRLLPAILVGYLRDREIELTMQTMQKRL